METVYCELKYSGVGMAFLLAGATSTIALVLATPFPMAARLALVAWIALIACAACRKLTRFRAVRIDRSRAILVSTADGVAHPGTLRDPAFVAPWLIVVRWRPDGARLDRTLPIFPDMAGKEDLRKIRVILRWA